MLVYFWTIPYKVIVFVLCIHLQFNFLSTFKVHFSSVILFWNSKQSEFKHFFKNQIRFFTLTINTWEIDFAVLIVTTRNVQLAEIFIVFYQLILKYLFLNDFKFKKKIPNDLCYKPVKQRLYLNSNAY